MHRHLGNQVLHTVIILLLVILQMAYSWLESLDQDEVVK
jgi:hypothetical protein